MISGLQRPGIAQRPAKGGGEAGRFVGEGGKAARAVRVRVIGRRAIDRHQRQARPGDGMAQFGGVFIIGKRHFDRAKPGGAGRGGAVHQRHVGKQPGQICAKAGHGPMKPQAPRGGKVLVRWPGRIGHSCHAPWEWLLLSGQAGPVL